MANFDSGVFGYVRGRAVVEMAFPIDSKGRSDIACKYCKFYVRSTQRCGLNQELIDYPEKYVGRNCPLEEVTEERIKEDEV